MVSNMLAVTWPQFLIAFLFVVVCVLLILIVLLQKGRGGGLSGAFGGAGGATAFGSKTGDVLTWATIVIAGIFLLYVVILSYVFVPTRAPQQATITAPPTGATPPAESTTPPPAPVPAGGGTPPLWSDTAR